MEDLTAPVSPLPDLETPRLFLKPRTLAHLHDCWDMDRDPEVHRFLSWPEDDEATYKEKLGSRIAQGYAPGFGHWCLYPKADPDRFLGWACLVPLPGHEPAVEVGYRLRRDAWGGGYVTEAARGLLRYGFDILELTRILAVADPENVRSHSVIARLDGTLVGMCRAYGAELVMYRFDRQSDQS